MRYDTGIANRLGNRSNNQDRCTIIEQDNSVLLLLADGMGGHQRGELAAQVMIDSIGGFFRQQSLPIPDPGAFLNEAVTRAHYDIAGCGKKLDPPVYPRTTCVACLIQGGSACWAHVGDSRLYLLRGQQVITRTRDHTYIEELLRNHVITEQEMSRHPMRNYVTYCLGGPEQAPPVTVSEEFTLKFNDIVLLCSDGLWNALDVLGITHILEGRTLDDAVNKIAEEAERSSYPKSDNISVIALRLLPDMEVNTDFNLNESTTATAPTVEASGKDQLRDAIEHIRGAINEYQDEIEKDENG